MSNTSPIDVNLRYLQLSEEYLAFARVWCDGRGLDAASWWYGDAGYRHRVVRSAVVGERDDSCAILDTDADAEVVDHLMRNIRRLQLQDVEDQMRPLRFINYDVWLMMRQRGTSPKSLFLRSGTHADSRVVAAINMILDACPHIHVSPT